SMYNGQANVAMLGAILFGLAYACEEKWNQSAAWLAVATFIKGYPLALALIMSVLWPRRFASRYFIGVGCGLLIPFATAKTSYVFAQYDGWLHHLNESSSFQRERVRTVENLYQIYAQPPTAASWLALQMLSGLAVLGRSASYAARLDLRQLL